MFVPALSGRRSLFHSHLGRGKNRRAPPSASLWGTCRFWLQAWHSSCPPSVEQRHDRNQPYCFGSTARGGRLQELQEVAFLTAGEVGPLGGP